jgi:acyl-CoA synthetase (NDP forming)
MHSLPDSHLLSHLGALYGSGKLADGARNQTYATAVLEIHRLLPVADIVLDDPREDTAAAITFGGPDLGDDS